MALTPNRRAFGFVFLCVISVSSSAGAVSDVTPPTATLTFPSAGATVSGAVTITANASDSNGIAEVQFLLDGKPLGAADTRVPYGIGWDTTTVKNGSHTLGAKAKDAAGNITTSRSVAVTVLNLDPRAAIGEWGPLLNWPLVAVHMTLLPTGKVLMWDAWERNAQAKVWDPASGVFAEVPNGSGIFCAAHCLLANGRVLVAGGHVGGHGTAQDGIPDVYTFDSFTKTWTRAADMRFPRWYPTAVPLADGRVLVLSGEIHYEKWADTPELYDPAANTWTILPGVDSSDLHTDEYHRGHLLPDGTVCFINPSDGRLRRLDVVPQRWVNWGIAPVLRGSTAMYRLGRILMTGGGNPTQSTKARADAMTLDLNQVSPDWLPIAPMAYPRYDHNLVLLPDGTVLAVGGTTDLIGSLGPGTFAAELWNPATGLWSALASMQDPRMYHSTALLLPDGRVLAAGGGRDDIAVDYLTAQLYSPPYLFKGPRPVITSAPQTLDYGAVAALLSPDADTVAKVVLLPLGSVTHTINSNQRYVELAFGSGEGQLDVQGPADPNLAPPGYYMLFLISNAGVPSTAAIVKLPLPDGSPAPLASSFNESNGQVVLEAEHYDAKVVRNSLDWVVDVVTSGYSRSAYLIVPTSGATYDANYTAKSPELIYNVRFKTTGTYSVWVRGWGNSGNDDSVHVGLDGAAVSSADRITYFAKSWTWKRDTMDGAPATIVIATPGLHTIHVWMREDGFKLDKLLLRTNSSATPPSGKGPSESPRVP